MKEPTEDNPRVFKVGGLMVHIWKTYSSSSRNWYAGCVAYEDYRSEAYSLMNEPDDHTRVRKVLDEWFRKSAIELLMTGQLHILFMDGVFSVGATELKEKGFIQQLFGK